MNNNTMLKSIYMCVCVCSSCDVLFCWSDFGETNLPSHSSVSVSHVNDARFSRHNFVDLILLVVIPLSHLISHELSLQILFQNEESYKLSSSSYFNLRREIMSFKGRKVISFLDKFRIPCIVVVSVLFASEILCMFYKNIVLTWYKLNMDSFILLSISARTRTHTHAHTHTLNTMKYTLIDITFSLL
jgi:hypothetical protein